MWFYIVLVILLGIGSYGLLEVSGRLWRLIRARGHYLRYHESEIEREQFMAKFPARYHNIISLIADYLTLIFGVVLFYWLLR